jgi:hypothetical protein
VKIIMLVLLALALWLLPMTLYAVFTARATVPVIYVPVELQHPAKILMVLS